MAEDPPAFQQRQQCTDSSTMEDLRPRSGCCGCLCSPSSKVAPLPGEYSRYEINEIRPGRYLRIIHIDAGSGLVRGNTLEHAAEGAQKSHQLHSSSPAPSPIHACQKDLPALSEECSSPSASLPNLPTSPVKTTDSGETKTHELHNGITKQHLNNSTQVASNISSTDVKGPSSPRHSKQYRISASSMHSPKRKPSNQMQSSAAVDSSAEKRVRTTSGIHCKVTEGQMNTAFANDHDTEIQSITGDTPREYDVNISSKVQTSPIRGGPGGDGPGVKPVMFLIHGVGGSADVWQAQIDFFSSRGYEIIAPDFIGHGFSCAPRQSAAYDFKEIMQDTLRVFDKYCKEQNVVIGHSYGASFAAVLARQRPQYVQKLVMLSGGSPTPLAPQPGLFSLPTCMLYCCWPVLKRGFKKSAFHDPNKSYIPQEHAFDVPTYVLKYTMNGQNWMDGDANYHKWIVAPTLLIHGREDQLITIDEEQDMMEVIENSQLVIVDEASHMVMLEKPNEVNELLENFLTDQVLACTEVASPVARRRMDPVTQSTASLKSVKSIPSNLLTNSLKRA